MEHYVPKPIPIASDKVLRYGCLGALAVGVYPLPSYLAWNLGVDDQRRR